jgi:hypothetical protein
LATPLVASAVAIAYAIVVMSIGGAIMIGVEPVVSGGSVSSAPICTGQVPAPDGAAL